MSPAAPGTGRAPLRVGRRRRAGNVVVLYHRIGWDDEDVLDMVVSPARLRSHLEALSAAYHVVPAGEIHIERSRPCVAVTFDDGYVDNALVAAPILSGLGLPATFFVTTDAIVDGREFWWDRLEHAVSEAPSHERLTVTTGPGGRLRLRFTTSGARNRALLQLSEVLVRRPASFIEETVAAVEALSAVDGRSGCQKHRRMSADDICGLAKDPLFDVGSHTCSHAPLAAMSDAECRRQVTESRSVLADIVGGPPMLFAYPYGRRGSMRRRDVAEVARAGYDVAFTNVRGAVATGPPLLRPRNAIPSWPADVLLERLGQLT